MTASTGLPGLDFITIEEAAFLVHQIVLARRRQAPGRQAASEQARIRRAPNLTAAEVRDLGYRVIIAPASSLRVASNSQAKLYGALPASMSCCRKCKRAPNSTM